MNGSFMYCRQPSREKCREDPGTRSLDVCGPFGTAFSSLAVSWPYIACTFFAVANRYSKGWDALGEYDYGPVDEMTEGEDSAAVGG